MYKLLCRPPTKSERSMIMVRFHGTACTIETAQGSCTLQVMCVKCYNQLRFELFPSTSSFFHSEAAWFTVNFLHCAKHPSTDARTSDGCNFLKGSIKRPDYRLQQLYTSSHRVTGSHLVMAIVLLVIRNRRTLNVLQNHEFCGQTGL